MNDLLEGTWNGHTWVEPRGRRLSLAGDEPAVQQKCVRCAREFLFFETSGRRLAVYAAPVSFFQLADEVTRRWLEEQCPGERLASDDADRQGRVGEISVSK